MLESAPQAHTMLNFLQVANYENTPDFFIRGGNISECEMLYCIVL